LSEPTDRNNSTHRDSKTIAARSGVATVPVHAASMRVALVGIDFGDSDFTESFAELGLLAQSCGAQVITQVVARRDKPDAAYFAGSGKVAEIALMVQEQDLQGVIFNHALTPAQQRNLQRELKARVIDRTTLILDIFALRAQSHEGKLQVELAQLRHLASRLVRQWSHLERQTGGIGMRGPGEKQLELDRRMLDVRVKRLQEDLRRLAKQRDTQRRSRVRGGTFKISLVGYTNAGKSTLFNALTHAGAYAADQLFATLDTTTRKMFLPDNVGGTVADTVGFIRELPHQLVEAFKATLEETIHADLILHVIDGASRSREVQIAQVEQVLAEIGAANLPRIDIVNKIDLTHGEPAVQRDDAGRTTQICLSARTGLGMNLLREEIAALAVAALDAIEKARDNTEPVGASALEPAAL
jgi:GTP-binding protein HflX